MTSHISAAAPTTGSQTTATATAVTATATTATAVTTRVVLAGMAGFATAGVVAGAFDEGYDPVRETISSLAAQDAGLPALMIAGFLAAATALVVAGVTLTGRVTGAAGRTGGILVTLAGFGMVAAGLARSDCSQSAQACLAREQQGLASTAHWTHQFVSLALFAALVVAGPLLARGLRRTPRLAHLARPTRWLALASLVTLVAFMSQAEGDWAGAVQRLFLLTVFGWPAWLTWATARAAAQDPASAR